MKVAIIGAGITGLSAGYYLSKKGVQVEIFEKEPYAGGLAASFKQKDWQWPLEFFFHHIFPSDKAVFELTKELGISDKIFFRRPITSVFIDGKIHPFDSPLALLKFPYLSRQEKLRMGAVLASFKFNPYWQIFEKTTAAKLLPKLMGKKPYQILWQPLLEGKFGKEADQISAAWFWARLKKRSAKLGYFQGGFQTLIDALLKEIEKVGGKIQLKTEIKKVRSKQLIINSNTAIKFDQLLAAIPTHIILKLLPRSGDKFADSIKSLKTIGAINLVLRMKKAFLADGTYWLNINDSSFPFCVVVQHTNFIDPKYYGKNHVLYVGGYYPQNHRYFKMTKEEIFQEFLPYLQKINPNFSYLSSIIYHLSFNLYAHPIIPVNYSQIIPPIKTPLPNLHLATMHHVYPWDRGVNYAIELGRKAANEILSH